MVMSTPRVVVVFYVYSYCNRYYIPRHVCPYHVKGNTAEIHIIPYTSDLRTQSGDVCVFYWQITCFCFILPHYLQTVFSILFLSYLRENIWHKNNIQLFINPVCKCSYYKIHERNYEGTIHSMKVKEGRNCDVSSRTRVDSWMNDEEPATAFPTVLFLLKVKR